MFNTVGLPGLKTAQSYYDKLASGDPNAISTAIGPAASGIAQGTQATIGNIRATAPPGGQEQLAEQEAKISGTGQIGNLITQAYTSAFPAEASLGQGGVGLSINEVANAIAGFQGAGTTVAQLGQEQAAGKAATLGFMGSLAGAGGEVGSAAILA